MVAGTRPFNAKQRRQLFAQKPKEVPSSWIFSKDNPWKTRVDFTYFKFIEVEVRGRYPALYNNGFNRNSVLGTCQLNQLPHVRPPKRKKK